MRLTDAQLYDAWEAELAQQSRPVNVALIASLETEAGTRGIDLLTMDPITAGVWNPDLHPRGRDGRFIDILGLIKLFNFATEGRGTFGPNKSKFSGRPGSRGKGSGAKLKKVKEGRGKVLDIIPDKNDRGNPWIKVQLDGPDGEIVHVKPKQVASLSSKARLDAPGGGKSAKSVDLPDTSPKRRPDGSGFDFNPNILGKPAAGKESDAEIEDLRIGLSSPEKVEFTYVTNTSTLRLGGKSDSPHLKLSHGGMSETSFSLERDGTWHRQPLTMGKRDGRPEPVHSPELVKLLNKRLEDGRDIKTPGRARLDAPNASERTDAKAPSLDFDTPKRPTPKVRADLKDPALKFDPVGDQKRIDYVEGLDDPRSMTVDEFDAINTDVYADLIPLEREYNLVAEVTSEDGGFNTIEFRGEEADLMRLQADEFPDASISAGKPEAGLGPIADKKTVRVGKDAIRIDKAGSNDDIAVIRLGRDGIDGTIVLHDSDGNRKRMVDALNNPDGVPFTTESGDRVAVVENDFLDGDAVRIISRDSNGIQNFNVDLEDSHRRDMIDGLGGTPLAGGRDRDLADRSAAGGEPRSLSEIPEGDIDRSHADLDIVGYFETDARAEEWARENPGKIVLAKETGSVYEGQLPDTAATDRPEWFDLKRGHRVSLNDERRTKFAEALENPDGAGFTDGSGKSITVHSNPDGGVTVISRDKPQAGASPESGMKNWQEDYTPMQRTALTRDVWDSRHDGAPEISRNKSELTDADADDMVPGSERMTMQSELSEMRGIERHLDFLEGNDRDALDKDFSDLNDAIVSGRKVELKDAYQNLSDDVHRIQIQNEDKPWVSDLDDLDFLVSDRVESFQAPDGDPVPSLEKRTGHFEADFAHADEFGASRTDINNEIADVAHRYDLEAEVVIEEGPGGGWPVVRWSGDRDNLELMNRELYPDDEISIVDDDTPGPMRLERAAKQIVDNSGLDTSTMSGSERAFFAVRNDPEMVELIPDQSERTQFASDFVGMPDEPVDDLPEFDPDNIDPADIAAMEEVYRETVQAREDGLIELDEFDMELQHQMNDVAPDNMDTEAINEFTMERAATLDPNRPEEPPTGEIDRSFQVPEPAPGSEGPEFGNFRGGDEALEIVDHGNGRIGIAVGRDGINLTVNLDELGVEEVAQALRAKQDFTTEDFDGNSVEVRRDKNGMTVLSYDANLSGAGYFRLSDEEADNFADRLVPEANRTSLTRDEAENMGAPGSVDLTPEPTEVSARVDNMLEDIGSSRLDTEKVVVREAFANGDPVEIQDALDDLANSADDNDLDISNVWQRLEDMRTEDFPQFATPSRAEEYDINQGSVDGYDPEITAGFNEWADAVYLEDPENADGIIKNFLKDHDAPSTMDPDEARAKASPETFDNRVEIFPVSDPRSNNFGKFETWTVNENGDKNGGRETFPDRDSAQAYADETNDLTDLSTGAVWSDLSNDELLSQMAASDARWGDEAHPSDGSDLSGQDRKDWLGGRGYHAEANRRAQEGTLTGDTDTTPDSGDTTPTIDTPSAEAFTPKRWSLDRMKAGEIDERLNELDSDQKVDEFIAQPQRKGWVTWGSRLKKQDDSDLSDMYTSLLASDAEEDSVAADFRSALRQEAARRGIIDDWPSVELLSGTGGEAESPLADTDRAGEVTELLENLDDLASKTTDVLELDGIQSDIEDFEFELQELNAVPDGATPVKGSSNKWTVPDTAGNEFGDITITEESSGWFSAVDQEGRNLGDVSPAAGMAGIIRQLDEQKEFRISRKRLEDEKAAKAAEPLPDLSGKFGDKDYPVSLGGDQFLHIAPHDNKYSTEIVLKLTDSKDPVSGSRWDGGNRVSFHGSRVYNTNDVAKSLGKEDADVTAADVLEFSSTRMDIDLPGTVHGSLGPDSRKRMIDKIMEDNYYFSPKDRPRLEAMPDRELLRSDIQDKIESRKGDWGIKQKEGYEDIRILPDGTMFLTYQTSIGYEDDEGNYDHASIRARRSPGGTFSIISSGIDTDYNGMYEGDAKNWIANMTKLLEGLDAGSEVGGLLDGYAGV